MRRLLDLHSRWWAVAVALLAALLVAGVLTALVVQTRERRQALDLAEASLVELEQVRAEGEADRAELLARIDELTVQVEQLQEQVRELGGEPAVVVVPEGTSARSPARPPSTGGGGGGSAAPPSRTSPPSAGSPRGDAPADPRPSPSPPPASPDPAPAPDPDPEPDEEPPGLLEGTVDAVCGLAPLPLVC